MTVYAFLAHGNPATLRHTLRAIGDRSVVVHVDVSTSLDAYPRQSNIRYVASRRRIHWGGFSMVEATLALYKAALEESSNPSEHVVLLSGQCVPIRPVQSLEHYLMTSPVKQHCAAGRLLDGVPRNENRVRMRWGFDVFDARERRFHALRSVARRFRRVALPTQRIRDFEGLSVVAGSQWTALTTGCLEDLLARDELVGRMRHLLGDSLAPDEIFFHSLVHSTSWGQQTSTAQPQAKGDKRTADFANLHYIDRSLTRTFSAAELEKTNFKDAYFLRKVDLSQAETELERVLVALQA